MSCGHKPMQKMAVGGVPGMGMMNPKEKIARLLAAKAAAATRPAMAMAAPTAPPPMMKKGGKAKK